MNKKEFYSIGRGRLNLNGNFYYGLDYAITDFMKNMETKNANLKQALNEIREISEEEVSKGTFDTNDDMEFANIVVKERFSKVLQIIDKVLGDEK